MTNQPESQLQPPSIDPPTLPPTLAVRVTAVAPAWHTFVLVFILMAVGGLTAWMFAHQPPAKLGGPMAQYIQTIIFQWLLFLFVWWGLRMKGVGLQEIFGRRWATWDDALLDVVIAAAFFFVSLMVRAVVMLAIVKLMHLPLGDGDAKQMMKALEPLLPHTAREITVALLLALTAGIVEETIFRGYLQRQFLALTGSATLAILLQGCVFAVGHFYQPKIAVFNIFILGLMLGMLAHWRKSLKPGMIMHAGQDSLSLVVLGLLGNKLMK